MENKKKPRSRTEQIVVQEMNGEVLIYDLRVNKAFCLNETAAMVWRACDGNNSIEDIRHLTGEQTRSEVGDDLVWLALDQLKKEKLLENSDEMKTPFSGVSRREVIKKIGLGTAIALPVVFSIVAPSAVHAASCNGVSCNCTGPRDGAGNCTSATCTAGCTCRGTNPAGMNGTCQI